MRGANLEEEIANELSEKMCSDIDFQILSDVLVTACDWTRIVLKPMTKEHSDAIDNWVNNNVKGPFQTRGIVWIFQNTSDAVNFTLKWAN